MCGKFTQLASWREVVAFSTPIGVVPDAPVASATPMGTANIIRLDENGARALTPMRWGLMERNAKAPGRPKHIHARAETIDTLPTFAEAFARRRGILPVTTFNEGEDLPNGKKRQWTITPKDRRPLFIAVIYEEWCSGADNLFTFAQITTSANLLISQVTDRMPAMLQPADWPVWLGETSAPPAAVKALLRTYDDGGNWEMAPQAPKAPTWSGRTGLQPDLF